MAALTLDSLLLTYNLQARLFAHYFGLVDFDFQTPKQFTDPENFVISSPHLHAM